MRPLSLEDYRHPVAGFSMPVPPGWERVEDPQPGIALITVEPVGAVDFRANMVVTVEDLPIGYDLERWQAEAERMLPGQLPNLALLDRELIAADAGPVLRRLAHYVADDTGSVTMEQWATVADGIGYTLTASIATLSYDSLADVFAEMALRFRAETGGTA